MVVVEVVKVVSRGPCNRVKWFSLAIPLLPQPPLHAADDGAHLTFPDE